MADTNSHESDGPISLVLALLDERWPSIAHLMTALQATSSPGWRPTHGTWLADSSKP